jgi:hypothetical protein
MRDDRSAREYRNYHRIVRAYRSVIVQNRQCRITRAARRPRGRITGRFAASAGSIKKKRRRKERKEKKKEKLNILGIF